MPQSVDLRIGKGVCTVPLEPALQWEVLQAESPNPDVGLTESAALKTIGESLARPVWGENSAAHKQAVLVLPDETRPAPSPKLLDGILNLLAEHGFTKENMSVLIASGTHRDSNIEALRSLWNLPDWVRVIRHDCLAPGEFVGQTGRGTRVELNPVYLKADLRITVSRVSFHYFAGYGGGPKMIFPGLASRSGVLQNHGLALASLSRGGLHSDCMPGRVKGNPVAEDLREAAALAPPEIALHWIPGANGDRFFFDTEGLDHCQATLRESARVRGGDSYDFVLASAGGHPFDIDLVQSHKSLRHASQFVRPGGVILLLAEGENGVGSRSLEEWLGVPDRPSLERKARSDYDLNAQTAISLRELAEDYQVVWVTRHLRSFLEPLGVNAVSTVESGLEICRDALPVSGGASRGAVLPRASSIIPTEV